QLALLYSEYGNCEHYHRARYPSAVAAIERAMSLRRDLANRFPGELKYQWVAATAEILLAESYFATGRFSQGEQTIRHAVDVQRQLWNRAPVTGKYHWQVCYALAVLGNTLASKRTDDREAEAILQEAIQRSEEVARIAPKNSLAVASLVAS